MPVKIVVVYNIKKLIQLWCLPKIKPVMNTNNTKMTFVDAKETLVKKYPVVLIEVAGSIFCNAAMLEIPRTKNRINRFF